MIAPHDAMPVGRLAPSPTGKLHLGHARTFLLAWLHARSRGGRVLLRIEDLDVPRVVPGAVDGILRDLEWLGLDWDGPIAVQSRGIDAIGRAVGTLVERGLAYPCVCTRADFRTMQSAPQAGVDDMRYPGTCRGRFRSIEEAEHVSGRPAGLRFVARDGPVRFTDGVHGAVSCDVSAEVGDFPIARKGGLPAYQIAVVVDDAAEGVTEIVRGDDLLGSTARQILLQGALGLPSPAWWHVPLVVDETGQRLAKRRDDLSLSEFRERGVDPRALVGWALRSCGIAGPSRMSAREVIPAFSIARLAKAPATVRRESILDELSSGNERDEN